MFLQCQPSDSLGSLECQMAFSGHRISDQEGRLIITSDMFIQTE